MSPALLTEPLVAFLEREVAIDVGACSAERRPSACRGFAARVSPGRDRLTVFVRRTEAAQLLQDVLSQDRVAVVFCLPATEAAVQVKGRRVSLSAATEAEAAHVQDYCRRFVDGIAALGYDRRFGEAYMTIDAGQMVAIAFTPEVVFEQTPGPRAGHPVEAAPA